MGQYFKNKNDLYVVERLFDLETLLEQGCYVLEFQLVDDLSLGGQE